MKSITLAGWATDVAGPVSSTRLDADGFGRGLNHNPPVSPVRISAMCDPAHGGWEPLTSFDPGWNREVHRLATVTAARVPHLGAGRRNYPAARVMILPGGTTRVAGVPVRTYNKGYSSGRRRHRAVRPQNVHEVGGTTADLLPELRPVDFHPDFPLIYHMTTTIAGLSVRQLKRAAVIKQRIERLEQNLASLLGAPAASSPAGGRKRHKMSRAARAKIAAAQKARWAKYRSAKAKK